MVVYDSVSFYARRIGCLAATCILLAAPLATADASGHHCDPTIRGIEGNPFGYRFRGDRCEGIYWKPYSTTGFINLVSLMVMPKNPSAAASGNISLHWPRLAFSSARHMHVRANSLLEEIFYRLDADLPANATSFSWPKNIINKFELTAEDVGFVVSSDLEIGSVEWKGYVPVSLSRPFGQGPGHRIEVGLMSDTTVKDVSWRRYGLLADGTPGALIDDGRTSETYLSGSPIKLVLPPQPDIAASYIEISAISLTGDSSLPPSFQFVMIEPQ